MRLLTVRILAAAMLLLVASSANAWRVDMTSNYDGVSNLAVNDTVTVTVNFDTEGGTDVILFGVGVLFDEARFEYVQSSSSTPTYLLYAGAKIPYLVPASTCTGTGGPPSGIACSLFGLAPFNQVQLDFLSSAITSLLGVPTASAPGGESLGTYVFRVKDVGASTADFSFIFEEARGDILQLENNTFPPLTLGSGFTVNLPEPTSALLSAAALLTLAGVRARRRETR